MLVVPGAAGAAVAVTLAVVALAVAVGGAALLTSVSEPAGDRRRPRELRRRARGEPVELVGRALDGRADRVAEQHEGQNHAQRGQRENHGVLDESLAHRPAQAIGRGAASNLPESVTTVTGRLGPGTSEGPTKLRRNVPRGQSGTRPFNLRAWLCVRHRGMVFLRPRARPLSTFSSRHAGLHWLLFRQDDPLPACTSPIPTGGRGVS